MDTFNKIVVLDGFTLNPGDLSWNALESLAQDCVIYELTKPEDLVERASGAAVLLTNKTMIGPDAIETLANSGVRYIGVLATGYNVVDVEAARRSGVAVTNVPAYSTNSVAQLTFALLLELANHVGHLAQTVRDGRWARSVQFSYWDNTLLELSGLTLGVIGYGDIRKAVARIGSALGMKIIAYRKPRNNNLGDVDVEFVELNDLLSRSDVVSLHTPLTPDTQNLINADRLKLMKPTAILLNTSRGPLVSAQDLADALNSGRLAGAGLDVLSPEPPHGDNPLLLAKNCIITPHVAWATLAARKRLMDVTIDNVHSFLDGGRLNRID